MTASTQFRSLLLVGGAPRVPVDAVRHLTVHATGTTVCQLAQACADLPCRLLLSIDARHDARAERFRNREELEAAVQRWIAAHPDGVLVLSAAINDYRVDRVEARRGDRWTTHPPSAKVPSGADELRIRLRPASKVVDRLHDWGHRGPLVAFKYQAAGSVRQAARDLHRRVGADLVVANSLDGSVQELVSATGQEVFPDRPALMEALAVHLRRLAKR